jgi:hypothetical protein
VSIKKSIIPQRDLKENKAGIRGIKSNEVSLWHKKRIEKESHLVLYIKL